MGYPANLSSVASNNSINIHQAIEWIMVNNDEKPKNNDQYVNDMQCNRNNIINCQSSQRMISLLNMYQSNHNDYNQINHD